MLTYQVRPRVFRFTSGEAPTFPAQGEIRFYFQPPQPFGAAAGGGHTAVRGVAASVLFNANSGEHTIESKEPLSPLDVTVEELPRTLRLAGTTFSISQRFASLSEMEDMIESVYFVFPTLVNVPFADPPYIERVDGKVGSTSFRWELAEWQMGFRTTTQEQQEGRFVKAWERMGVLSERHRRRLVAGLHYFHVACRLARAGSTPGEFVAEVVLNLAKSLEVLFPPAGDARTRDAARAGLRNLGFSENQIECDFIPAMALRNEIDVGHVELGLFTMDQFKTIHAFTERAEGAFREMLERFLSRIESGQADIAPHELGPPRDKAVQLIKRLQESGAGGTG
ncbi:MAG: hypothetical protein JSV19_01095 [Phycisphaerales bacterium]|nr:MAG: hypothetical protein JSV19_01095 [Phycisphaerales bacterium]